MRTQILSYSRYTAACALALVGLWGIFRPFVAVALGTEPLRHIGWGLILSSLLWGTFLAAAYLFVGRKHRLWGTLFVLIGCTAWGTLIALVD